MNDTNGPLIQTGDVPVTLLRVEAGYTNNKGEVYDKNGVFINFPRELGSKQRANIDPASVKRQFKQKRVGCVVQERRNYSYYHWTYETLPKLIYLSKNKKELGVDKLYFHFGRIGHPYQREALRRLGFNRWQILDAKKIESLKAKEIVVVRLNESRLKPSFQLCQTIKSAFVQQPVQRPYRKIYLTRDHVKTGRKLINEFELRDLLASYGFQTIVADNLTVAAQARLFNESEYIVSPHGAALANIAFCEPGTKVLELFNQADRSTWSPLYSTIAQVCNLELVPVAPAHTKEISASNHRSNFYADLNAIKRVFAHWRL